MNGLTRRTYTVKQETPGEPSRIVIDGILTYEEAESQTRIILVDTLDALLSDQRLLSYRKDHEIVLEPMPSTHGMRLIDRCLHPQEHSTEPAGDRVITSVWFYIPDPE